ncbi:MAG: hypothetical protein HYX69_06855 [Planctomycetia bacterium]|nr:hypothetical protein [Planctomycetia bacterium]
MKKVTLLLLAGAIVMGLSLSTAQAIAPFKKEFDAKYVKKDSTVPSEQVLAAAVDKAKCLVCHAKNAEGKEDKKLRNPYGQALDQLLDKKTDMNNKQKIQEALDKVAEMKSNASDPKSPTFGDLIKQGKLPGGEN